MINGTEGRPHMLGTPSPADPVALDEDSGVIRLLDLDEPDLYFVKTPSTYPTTGNSISKTVSRAPKADTAFTLQYLNKGAANVVFKIIPASLASSAITFMPVRQVVRTKDGMTARVVPLQGTVLGKVLRIPRGNAKTLSGDMIVSEFHKIIKPMFQTQKSDTRPAAPHAGFSKHLMDHQGVLLFPSVVARLRSLADHDVFNKQADHSRTCWGILLEDMSPVHGSSIVIEIKPKWLLQSPDAPPRAKRCRTCATQITAPKKRATYICPLRLINTNADSLRPWLHAILADSSNQIPTKYPSPQFVNRIVDHLLVCFTTGEIHALLTHLQTLQAKLDPHGVLAQHPLNTPAKIAANFHLRAAMTLRDCSLFIKLEYDAATGVPTGVTCKLGDLDFKSAEKTGEWADKESRLVRMGLYTKELEDDFGCWFPRLGGKK